MAAGGARLREGHDVHVHFHHFGIRNLHAQRRPGKLVSDMVVPEVRKTASPKNA